MADERSGGRLAWKDRIDQSPWVDNAPWVPEGGDQGDGVEFLEAEPSAYRLSETPREPTRAVASGPSPRLLILGAVGVVLVALAIMSRPSDQDPFEQLPPDKQQEIRQRLAGPDPLIDQAVADEQAGGAASSSTDPDGADDTDAEDANTTGAAAATGGDADSSGAVAPIPALRGDLPEDLPGRILTYGTSGTIVRIERALTAPEETALDELEPGAAGTMTTVGSDLVLLAGGTGQIITDDLSIQGGQSDFDVVLPADAGAVVIIDRGQTLVADLLTLDGEQAAPAADGEVTEESGWVFGEDVEILGGWRDRILVYKAGVVWAVDRDGGSARVTDGQLLGYDGSHLAVVRCGAVSSCQIEVGPPSAPGQRSIPVPDRLTTRDLASWTGAVDITSDGSKLGLIDRRVSVPLPMWIDMETAEVRSRSETINPDSAIAWSPDGVWLAYVFGDDLILWNIELDRSWRVTVDRQIGLVHWTDLPADE